MGKTIQMIALMVSDSNRPNLVVAYVLLAVPMDQITLTLYLAHRPTVAIMQWRNEIQTHTTDGMKVLVWHGTNRENNVKELAKYDVVLTTVGLSTKIMLLLNVELIFCL